MTNKPKWSVTPKWDAMEQSVTGGNVTPDGDYPISADEDFYKKASLLGKKLEYENRQLRKALKLLVQHCPTTFTFPNDAELQRAEMAAENLLIELGEL